MQTNEEKCFTAIFRDVTKEEASELCNHPKWTAGAWGHALDQRDDARHEVAKLRAQADARPIYQLRRADGAWTDQTEQSYLNNQQHCASDTRIVYTHPEASAPGLSDEDRSLIQEASTYIAGMSPWGHKSKYVIGLRAILTRASAATVGEASELAPCIGQCGNAVPDDGVRICHECAQAAQQQAEPGADELAAFEKWFREEPSLDANWQDCRDAWCAAIGFAAQSGQRAGVVEDAIEAAAKKLAEDFDYPWEHMPAQGKDDFRAKVRNIAAMLAAPTQQQEGGKE